MFCCFHVWENFRCFKSKILLDRSKIWRLVGFPRGKWVAHKNRCQRWTGSAGDGHGYSPPRTDTRACKLGACFVLGCTSLCLRCVPHPRLGSGSAATRSGCFLLSGQTQHLLLAVGSTSHVQERAPLTVRHLSGQNVSWFTRFIRYSLFRRSFQLKWLHNYLWVTVFSRLKKVRTPWTLHVYLNSNVCFAASGLYKAHHIKPSMHQGSSMEQKRYKLILITQINPHRYFSHLKRWAGDTVRWSNRAPLSSQVGFT